MQIRNLIALLLAAGLAGCTNGNGAVEPPVTSVNISSPSYSNLQFNVGTANIGGTVGLNTVVTLRQPNGLSALGYTTPAITWDGAFVNTAGGATSATNSDAGLKQITGTLPPVNPANLPSVTGTFGTGGDSWGAFGYGFDPANSDNGPANASVQDPCLPFFANQLPGALNLTTGSPACTTAGGAQFQGGPPAFTPNVRSNALAGSIGYFLGFTPFVGIVPAANPATPGKTTFTLNISVPTSPVTKLGPVTATMQNFAGLPTFATPTLTLDGAGGGSIAYALPAGVTEALIIVENWGPTGTGASGNCNYGFQPGLPYVYSVLVKPGSPNPIGLGGAAPTSATGRGDNLAATPAVGSFAANLSTQTICTAASNSAAQGAGTLGDSVDVIAVGFDYPAYEAAYPQSNGNPTPSIASTAGAPTFGQADVTISDLSPMIVSP